MRINIAICRICIFFDANINVGWIIIPIDFDLNTTVAHKEGKNVTLFLLDEGVSIAKQGLAANIRAATGDACDDHLTYLQAHDVPILVCTPCAAARQIGEADLIENARMATGGQLIDLACDAAVISL